MKKYSCPKAHHGKTAFRTSHRLRVLPLEKLKREFIKTKRFGKKMG